jgi:hypothetical protein
MKFILDEKEYKELQLYKNKYDELLKKHNLTKEEFLEDYFKNSKGDTVIKIPTPAIGGKETYYYLRVDSNDPRFDEKIFKNSRAEIVTKLNQ